MSRQRHHNARRRAREEADEQARIILAVTDVLVPAIWSNRSYQWFHLGCVAHAPPPTIELGLRLGQHECCAGCGLPIGIDPERHANGDVQV